MILCYNIHTNVTWLQLNPQTPPLYGLRTVKKGNIRRTAYGGIGNHNYKLKKHIRDLEMSGGIRGEGEYQSGGLWGCDCIQYILITWNQGQ